MNIYDVYLNICKDATDEAKEYARYFLMMNDDHFERVEGIRNLNMLMVNLREAQSNGVAIEVDTIFKRCPYDTYEDVTSRYVMGGTIKNTVTSSIEPMWKLTYPTASE